MTLDEIQAFLAVAASGGFSRAAQRLHRSQPAISRRLDMLEQELGAPLFERLRTNVRLTEAGRVFQPYAEAALAALQDGRDAVRGLQAGELGSISVALVGTLADTHIANALRGFAAQSSRVRLELRTASSKEVTELVRRGEATLGLRYYASDRPELVSLDAGSEAMVVVAAPDHPLAGWPIEPPRLLAGERWVGFPPSPGQQDSAQTLQRQLTRAGLDGAEVTLIDSLTAQKRMVQAGFGLALVPESSVQDELRQGMLVTLDVPLMRTRVPITAIHRRNGYLSFAAKALLGRLVAGGVERDGSGGRLSGSC